MNRPDFLSQLPSLDELLEHPRVASALKQLDRSSAVSKVRTAVANLSAEVTRRAEGLSSATPGELLDRLVRNLEVPRAKVAPRAINATGRLFEAGVGRLPLAQAALDAAVLAAEGGQPGGAAAAARDLLGCGAARAFNSAPTALGAALEGLAGGGACIVARSDMTELAPGLRVDDVCRRAGCALHEVGAVDSTALEDYLSALSSLKSSGADRIVVLLRAAASDAESTLLQGLRNSVGQGGATLLADRALARPSKESPAYADRSPSVEETLSAGADLVVFDAAGQTGGPVAGVLAGNASMLEEVAGSVVAKSDALEPITDAALAATFTLFKRPSELRFTHPLHQLLDAPIENLQQRAERIATQLSACDGVDQAVARSLPSRRRAESWGVEVGLTDVASTRQSLVEASIPVVADFHEGGLTLDLATVFASQDVDLVRAFT